MSNALLKIMDKVKAFFANFHGMHSTTEQLHSCCAG
jgi:hypothetical protein